MWNVSILGPFRADEDLERRAQVTGSRRSAFTSVTEKTTQQRGVPSSRDQADNESRNSPTKAQSIGENVSMRFYFPSE